MTMSLPFTPDLRSSFKKKKYFKIIIIILRNFFMTSIILLTPFFFALLEPHPPNDTRDVDDVRPGGRPSGSQSPTGLSAVGMLRICRWNKSSILGGRSTRFSRIIRKEVFNIPLEKKPKRHGKKLAVSEGIPFI